MLEKSAHEVVGKLAELRIAVLVIEQWLSVLLEEHMYVHSVACLTVDGLGHEGCGAALLECRIADDVLGDHGVIRHLCYIGKLDLDLELTGAADLVMMILDLYSPIFHEHAHLTSEVVVPILGCADVVAALVWDLESVTAVSGVPIRFLGIYLAADGIGLGFKADVVKDMEFEFRPDDHFIGYAGGLHVLNSGFDDIARILVKGLVLGTGDDHRIAAHGESRNFGKGVHRCGAEIRNEHHIAVLNRSIAVVGAVKADAILHRILIETLCGYGDMPPPAVNVDHLKVDHFDLVVLDEFLYFLDGSLVVKQHGYFLLLKSFSISMSFAQKRLKMLEYSIEAIIAFFPMIVKRYI